MKNPLLCCLLTCAVALADESPIAPHGAGPAAESAALPEADALPEAEAEAEAEANGGYDVLTEATMLLTEFNMLLSSTSATLRGVTDRASADAAADELEKLNDSLSDVFDKLLGCSELAEGGVENPYVREAIDDTRRFLMQIDEQTSDLEAKDFYGSDTLRRALFCGEKQQ